MLLPRHCAVCRRAGPPLCPACASLLLPAPEGPPPTGLDRCVALFAYEGAGREVVAGLKYTNHRDALVPLGTALAHQIDAPIDLVSWIPTSSGRRHRRGYDQAQLLARVVARTLRVPVRPTLRRRGGEAKTGRSRAERSRASFDPVGRVRPGLRVALVDDVRTTGSSLAAGAAALRAAGAGSVVGATLAVTPGPGAGSSRSGRRSLPGPRGDPLQSG